MFKLSLITILVKLEVVKEKLTQREKELKLDVMVQMMLEKALQ